MPNRVATDTLICTVDGCERLARNTRKPGMCNLHMIRSRKGANLSDPARQKRSAEEVLKRDDLGRKVCLSCGLSKPETAFTESRWTPDLLKSRCGACTSDATRLKRMGISFERYADMLKAQAHRCAICNRHEAEFTGTMNIDHDHGCCPGKESCGKCVRGLLCPNCNMGIGAMWDDPRVLRAALTYLERGAL